jgi:hypothetical protein
MGLVVFKKRWRSKMKKSKKTLIILLILFASLSIILANSNYQLRKDLKSSQYLLIYNSNDLLNSYLYILNFEKQIVENKNESERQGMLVTHGHLMDILDGQRNSIRGTLFREKEISKEYQEQKMEWNIHKNMYDFNKSTSLNSQRELIDNLESNIEVFKKFIETIEYKEPEI